MSADPPKTTVSQVRYVQGNRELIRDPAVVEEFDRLAAFILGTMTGMGQREVERDLDYGQDREGTFEFERGPLNADGFNLTLSAAREGARAAALAAGLTSGQAEAAADAAEASVRASEVVPTTDPPPYPGLGPDPGVQIASTPAETTIVFPFSDSGMSDVLPVAFDFFPIAAGHGDLVVMEASVVFTTLTCVGYGASLGFDDEIEILTRDGGGVVIDETDGTPFFNFVGDRNVSVSGDWSTDYRTSIYNAPYGGLPLTSGFGLNMSGGGVGGLSFQNWSIAGTMTIIVQGYVP